MPRALARLIATLIALLPVTAVAADPPSPLTVSAVEVVAEREAPQVCVTFSDRLDRVAGGDFRSFVEVAPPGEGAVLVRDKALCIEGLRHDQTYSLTLREGLPGVDGHALAATETHAVAVPNRRASLAFRGSGPVLPRIGAVGGLTLRSINVDRVRLQVSRLADRALVERIYFGRITQQLSDREIAELTDRAAQEVWKGDMAVSGPLNQPVTTAFPLDAVLGTLNPGVYVAIAASDSIKGEPWERRATQWFVVSDLGLNTLLGDDGLLVFARSLATADPATGVELRLLSRGGQDLGKVTTGADGIARFDAALLRGTGDAAPQALFAYYGNGDFGFLDLVAPAFELADRSTIVPAPSVLDAYLWTERGIYRPGEAVNLTALLRDAAANPVTPRPLTLRVMRPDGLEVDRRELAEGWGGAYAARIDLPPGAYPGDWTATVHAEPEGPSVGAVRFKVEDFVPPRLQVSLLADRPVLAHNGEAQITVAGQYLYGAPAADLPGELSVTVRAAADPYPQHPGYRFGLAQEETVPLRTALPGFVTGTDGVARATVRLEREPESSRPLEAVIQATLVDVGGQPVQRELVLPVRHRPLAIGIKPRFAGDTVAEGTAAGFDVIAVAPDGQPVDKADLSYELFEEEYAYNWFEANGRWDYKVEVRDRRLAGGTLATAAAKPGLVEEAVASGRYRLEVFDPATGVAAGVRFAAGWWLGPVSDERPDAVDVTVMRPHHRAGETALVYVRPPYRSQVMIAVADRSVRQAMTRAIGPEGAFLEIPVDPAWAGGVHVIASAYGLPDPQHKGAPRRAVGVAWLGIDQTVRYLGVRVDAPAESAPRRTVEVKVAVTGSEPGRPAYVALAAVDEGVLRLTDQRSPDPARHYFAPQDLAVELRDVYGRLVEPSARQDHDGAVPSRWAMLPARRSAAVVSLFTGIRPVSADGTVSVPLDLPDVQARLRVTAVAWSDGRFGRAEAMMDVRDPVLAEAALPRFLAPGDRAGIGISLQNAGGPIGTYRAVLTALGAVTLEGADAVEVALDRNGQAVVPAGLLAGAPGAGTLKLDLTGPDGAVLSRSWGVTVRATERIVVRRKTETVPPDGVATLAPDLVADLRPGTVSVALTLGALPELDVAGLLLAAERGMGIGAEQSASRALALFAMPDAAAGLGLGSPDDVRQRAQAALDRALTYQRSDGGFAAWTPRDPADAWLTAYLADVLTRARAAGLRVPNAPFDAVMNALRRSLENTWVEAEDLPARAYTLYVLARAKAIDAGPLRYFRETFGDKLPTSLARAQVGAAFAALGDGRAAGELFDRLAGARAATARDHGSALRDEAAVLALMAESGLDQPRIAAAGDKLAASFAAVRMTSPQERAWLVLAARALIERAPAVKAVVADQPVEATRPALRRLDPAALPLTLRNAGGEAMRVQLSLAGAPSAPQPAEQNGFTIARRIFDMDGQPVDAGTLPRNARVVVILEGEATDPQTRSAIVVDPLPAGFVVEAVRVADSGPLGGLTWLGGLSSASHVESRDDRFIAAVDLPAAKRRFRLAYLVRAATPGDFVVPAPWVEDLFRPHLSARGAAARTVVRPE